MGTDMLMTFGSLAPVRRETTWRGENLNDWTAANPSLRTLRLSPEAQEVLAELRLLYNEKPPAPPEGRFQNLDWDEA